MEEGSDCLGGAQCINHVCVCPPEKPISQNLECIVPSKNNQSNILKI